MLTTKTYKVANHIFRIKAETESFLWEKMVACYGPFEVASEDVVFEVEICDDVYGFEGLELVYSNRATVEPDFMGISVFKSENEHYFEFSYPGSKMINGRLAVSKDYKKARFTLDGTQAQQWYTFNSGMNICFLLATACLDTVFVHASCVRFEGKAYLFLGKSGTGKSTHSRMWLDALEGVELMNDDHPVIRIGSDGHPVAYGSPWSGKTRCYKDVEAPVGVS